MIVGVDVGSQSLKVVVLDEALKLLGQAATHYQPSYPRPGWAEQDARLWEDALGPTVAAALRQAGAPADRVEAVGIAGQLDGCVAVGRDARALGPALIWMDRRAVDETRDIDPLEIRRLTGLVLDAGHMAAKIRWLKRHAPWAAEARCFHQPVSYLVERLTGARRIDRALASTTMLYGLSSGRYEPALLAAFGIEAEVLPELAGAAEPAGMLTRAGAELIGLPEGIPVAVGTGDDFSNPLGAGLTAPGRVACALGTAEVVGALHPEPLIDERALVETHAYAGGHYFLENPGWLSGGALTWFAGLHGLPNAQAIDRLAEPVPCGAEDVLFLPALSGAMAPEWHAAARGAFYGLSAAHGVEHLARAVLEGCAFAMRDVIERLGELGVACRSILLLGGGARSRLWGQIRADIAGLPVEVPANTNTSPAGAALLAAVAAGVYPHIGAAARQIAQTVACLEPDAARHARYDAAYGRYRRLFESLKPMFGAAP